MKKHLWVALSMALSTSALAGDGLTSIKSDFSVTQSADRFEKILNKKGLTVFARINHSANASKVNLKLAPTEVVIFGNPKVGTPLMQCSKTVAIDLPQKALFWQDQTGQAWVSYNEPAHLKARHNIQGCDKVINKISNVLNKLSHAAVKK